MPRTLPITANHRPSPRSPQPPSAAQLPKRAFSRKRRAASAGAAGGRCTECRAAQRDADEAAIVPAAAAPPALLVIDLNGFLALRSNRQVAVRPHAASFVRWATERFAVSVWSTMALRNIEPVLQRLLEPELAQRLLCVWGGEQTVGT
jgi:hypothetical protein